MATDAKKRRKSLMTALLVLVAAAALCLVAMAAGWISSPLWDSMFGGNGSGSSQTSGNGSGGNGGGSGSCFLGLVCFNSSGDSNGVNAQATVVSP